jgi:hypothetical protein
MIAVATLLDLLNARKNRVLLYAEAALPQSQFNAFKKLFLDEFGRSGLEGQLVKLDAESRQGRNGQEQTAQERGCHHE